MIWNELLRSSFLASIYYDYIFASHYSFDGFYIEQEERFNLSSITLNNRTSKNVDRNSCISLLLESESDACSSAARANDSLCGQNTSTPYCINLFPNPWLFNCRWEMNCIEIFLQQDSLAVKMQVHLPILPGGVPIIYKHHHHQQHR